MCHLLEQLNLTSGLPSWALTDPGHFLWMPIRAQYKYSREAATLLAQITPLWNRAGLHGLLDCGVHSFRTSSVGISSGLVVVFYFFFFLFLLFFFFFSFFFLLSLTSGVYPFANLSTPPTEKEKGRETDGQTHRQAEWAPPKSFGKIENNNKN